LIPKNILHSLGRQDLLVLYEIKDLVERLITDRGIAANPDELPVGREVLREEKLRSITYRLERVSCGKNCKGCPHGPYWYGYWREGGKTHSKYIGKNLRTKS